MSDSERQGSSLQLQLEQTSSPHPASTTSSSSSSSRDRATGPARQTRSKPQRRPSPYHQAQSRDTSHLPLDHYTPVYDQRHRYYYDESYQASYSACMMDCEFTSSHDDRLISTASSLVPYNYTLYCTPDPDDHYVSAQRSPSPRDKSACAVHSSVIVRRCTSIDTQTTWPDSCCEPVVRRYGSEDRVGGKYVMVNGEVAGYTSVIVATPGGTH